MGGSEGGGAAEEEEKPHREGRGGRKRIGVTILPLNWPGGRARKFRAGETTSEHPGACHSRRRRNQESVRLGAHPSRGYSA